MLAKRVYEHEAPYLFHHVLFQQLNSHQRIQQQDKTTDYSFTHKYSARDVLCVL